MGLTACVTFMLWSIVYVFDRELNWNFIRREARDVTEGSDGRTKEGLVLLLLGIYRFRIENLQYQESEYIPINSQILLPFISIRRFGKLNW